MYTNKIKLKTMIKKTFALGTSIGILTSLGMTIINELNNTNLKYTSSKNSSKKNKLKIFNVKSNYKLK